MPTFLALVLLWLVPGKRADRRPSSITYLKHRRQDNSLKPTVSTWVTMPSKPVLVSKGFAAEVDGVSLWGTVQLCPVTSLVSLATLCTWDGHKHWTLRQRQACINALYVNWSPCLRMYAFSDSAHNCSSRLDGTTVHEVIPWWKSYLDFLQTLTSWMLGRKLHQ